MPNLSQLTRVIAAFITMALAGPHVADAQVVQSGCTAPLVVCVSARVSADAFGTYLDIRNLGIPNGQARPTSLYYLALGLGQPITDPIVDYFLTPQAIGGARILDARAWMFSDAGGAWILSAPDLLGVGGCGAAATTIDLGGVELGQGATTCGWNDWVRFTLPSAIAVSVTQLAFLDLEVSSIDATPESGSCGDFGLVQCSELPTTVVPEPSALSQTFLAVLVVVSGRRLTRRHRNCGPRNSNHRGERNV